MEFFKLIRTVSYYNDEVDDILQAFYDEYRDNKTLVEAEVIEEHHISGAITEYIVADNFEEAKAFCRMAECLVGECFSLYNLKGELIITEEYADSI